MIVYLRCYNIALSAVMYLPCYSIAISAVSRIYVATVSPFQLCHVFTLLQYRPVRYVCISRVTVSPHQICCVFLGCYSIVLSPTATVLYSSKLTSMYMCTSCSNRMDHCVLSLLHSVLLYESTHSVFAVHTVTLPRSQPPVKSVSLDSINVLFPCTVLRSQVM